MRFEVLRDSDVESEIGVSPDYLDRNVKSFHLREAFGVATYFFENLRGHLRKGGTGSGSFSKVEVIIDDRGKH
jgi:hypothetical protein